MFSSVLAKLTLHMHLNLTFLLLYKSFLIKYEIPKDDFTQFIGHIGHVVHCSVATLLGT